MQVQQATREVLCKIVFVGPGRCGKTTNIEALHERLPAHLKGNFYSLATDGDRTLLFDLLRVDYGEVKGHKLRFALYTVPGQVYYAASRVRVLRGADGIVFVADSNPAKFDANLVAMQGLYDNLHDLGIDPAGLANEMELPYVIQYNKRDLKDAVPIDQLQAALNPDAVPAIASVATEGQGVFETLDAILSRVARMVRAKL